MFYLTGYVLYFLCLTMVYIYCIIHVHFFFIITSPVPDLHHLDAPYFQAAVVISLFLSTKYDVSP